MKSSVEVGGRRIVKKKKAEYNTQPRRVSQSKKPRKRTPPVLRPTQG